MREAAGRARKRVAVKARRKAARARVVARKRVTPACPEALFPSPPPHRRFAFPQADRDEHGGQPKHAREKAGRVLVRRKDNDGNGQQDEVGQQDQPAFPCRWQPPTPAVGLGREPVPGRGCCPAVGVLSIGMSSDGILLFWWPRRSARTLAPMECRAMLGCYRDYVI